VLDLTYHGKAAQQPDAEIQEVRRQLGQYGKDWQNMAVSGVRD
jgi:hypothetical protein